ncbi:MAG TPA: OstA-like protein [Rhodothermales bacterium]|nr:OstA-like protein [Rhodothermales bacterium]
MKRVFFPGARRSVLPMLLALMTAGAASGQADEDTSASERIVVILNADSARAMRVDGELADELMGNVALRQGHTMLTAARAIRFKTSDQIIFEGSVSVVDEGDSLSADRVVYESDVKTGVGTGNVRWSDGEVAITATLARYFLDEEIAEFEGDVVMEDSTTTVLSLAGKYDVDSRVASFWDDVYLEQRRLALTAEVLTHERESGLTTASGGVWIYRIPDDNPETSDARVVLVADSAGSNRDSGLNHLSGGAGLVRIETGNRENDTLIVRSGAIIAEFTDSTDTFNAAEDVRFLRGNLAGRADSLHYSSLSDSVSSIRMLGEPFVWSADAQVNGDTVDVHTESGRPRVLLAYENAYVGFQDTTGDFVHQLKGRRLEAFFEEDSLRRLELRPNAEALYFALDSTSEDQLSAMRFTSTQIRIEFEDGEIHRITASDDVEGELTEIDDNATHPFLQGFQWRGLNRPKREDLLDANVVDALIRFEPL